MKVKVCATIFFLLLSVNSVGQTRKKLTQAEAARRFEEFVIENGFTDLPPTTDKSKLRPDPMFGITAFSMGLRRNSLERKPAKLWKGNRFYRNGWAAFFLAKNSDQPRVGNLIYMDAYGKRIYIEHQTFHLSDFERKK